jgi:Ca2+-binding EF-hand superfamily protein
LPKINGKVKYADLLNLITQHGNRNHNPFKSLIKKLEWFIETNKLDVKGLLLKLNDTAEVTISGFAKFLHEKVEKNKDLENLKSYVKLMDIDKDGFITKEDLQTCLLNINSE